jgi:hypothetical protein
VGTLGVWDWMASGQSLEQASGVVTWHVHLSLLTFYRDLVAAAATVSLITCYQELGGILERATGVTCAESLIIPPQAANVGARLQEAQYPDVYQRLCEEIASRERHGQLFLVGAGFLGKYYCELIKRSGGMAVDVGSLMDVWMGLSVRSYHTPEFVGRHSIQEATEIAP